MAYWVDLCLQCRPITWFQNGLTALVGCSLYAAGAAVLVKNYKDVDPENSGNSTRTVPGRDDYEFDVGKIKSTANLVEGLMLLNAVLVLAGGVLSAVFLRTELRQKRRSQASNGHIASK